VAVSKIESHGYLLYSYVFISECQFYKSTLLGKKFFAESLQANLYQTSPKPHKEGCGWGVIRLIKKNRFSSSRACVEFYRQE
jgi:hypothetical protein